MSRLAFTTFGILKQPYGHPEVQPFDDRTPSVFEEAERAQGFVARAQEVRGDTSMSNFERDWGAWGAFEVPRFYQGGRTTGTDSRASTISLWQDIESVYRFVYNGLHKEALSHRHDWFLKPAWPTYAMWWIANDHVPTWTEACRAIERLHDHGATPEAFDFKHPFDENGESIAPLTATARLTSTI